MSLTINKLLTPYNYAEGKSTDRIRFIVIHYVGALGGAKENCQYYASRYIGASAHYYVGFTGEYWQSVKDKDIAWHCGSSAYTHPECRNSNSIGIELCVRKKNTKSLNASDKDWYFEDATVKAGIILAKELMKKYNISPKCVIRHYDVTGKICPNPYVYNTNAHTWNTFWAAISESVREKNNDGTYTVKKGDTLWAIGKDFNCTVSQLKEWNKLTSDIIYVGRHLQLWYWKGKVVTNTAPVRAGAGKNKKLVATLKKGEVLEVLGSTKSEGGKKWYKIRCNRQVRYIYNKRIERI